MTIVSAVIYEVSTGRIRQNVVTQLEFLPDIIGVGEEWKLAEDGETGETHYVAFPGTSAHSLVAKTAFAITQDKTAIDDDGVDAVTWSNVPADTDVRLVSASNDVYTTAAAPAVDTVQFTCLYKGTYTILFEHTEYISENFTITVNEVLPWA